MKKTKNIIFVTLLLSALLAGNVFAADSNSHAFLSVAIQKSREELSSITDAENKEEIPAEASNFSISIPEEEVSEDEDSATKYIDFSTIEKVTMDEIRDDLLEALDNDIYRTTLDSLRSGKEIAFASTGDVVSGMQQTLVNLGCSIDVDGSAGPLTFEALHNLQKSFGFAQTETVDASTYEQLLPLLLMRTDEARADELLPGLYDFTEDACQYVYLKGCTLASSGHYYQAKDAFEASQYGDYEERSAACVQPYPKNGELWHNARVFGQDMHLTFTVNRPLGTTDAGRAMMFEVYQENGTLAATLFLSGSDSVTTMLPGGKYRIQTASGNDWYGMEDAFGPEGNYQILHFHEIQGAEYLTELDAGFEWKITINITENDTDLGGIDTDSLNWEEWQK